MPKQNSPAKVPSQANSVKKLKRQLERTQSAARTAQTKKIYLAAKAREKDLKLKLTLTAVKGKGIYEPRGDTLTRYRKNRLNKIANEFGDFFDLDRFEFIPAPKEKKKSILERALGMDLKITSTGLFVPKNNYKSVKLKKDKKRDEYYIERSGKTKWGINAGRKYKSVMPIASVDELDNEIDRLKNMAKKLGPLGDKERLGFIVSENGFDGASEKIFPDIKALMDYLNLYQKTIPARIQFYRHITVVKTENVTKWYQDHPVRKRKASRKRIHSPRSIYNKPR